MSIIGRKLGAHVYVSFSDVSNLIVFNMEGLFDL